MKILITGCAGFIGFSLSRKLLDKTSHHIIGIDSLNNEYDSGLKKDRMNILTKYKKFTFHKININNYRLIKESFLKERYDRVIHLAAQAGVRKSIHDPDLYLKSNIIGQFNILKASNLIKLKHLIFASSSSVYGKSNKFPLYENDKTDSPESFYAATKKSNEVIAMSFSKIYFLPITALRFFTVYGEYGRPDMAPYKFTKKIINGETIDLFNSGDHYRDFTYIDDITINIIKLINKIPKKSNIKAPFEIFNIGNGSTIRLSKFVNLIEKKLGKKAKIKKLPMQRGDVYKTYASNKKLKNIIKLSNTTPIEQGMQKFIDWFKSYHKIN